jgi:site-specific DNA-methyltransferase (adenine-specific)
MTALANQILNMDCLDGFKMLADSSIDMLFSDWPYGTTENAWDTPLPLDLVWPEIKRVVKPSGAILLFAQCPFDKALGASNLKMLKYEWVWDKGHGTNFLNAKIMPLKQTENILVFYRKLPTYNPIWRYGEPYVAKRPDGTQCDNYKAYRGKITVSLDGRRYPINLLRFTFQSRDIVHPTQKPVDLCAYLVKTYTNPGDIVLDNCAGSGTIPVACVETERKFIGFEKDRGYWEKAVGRVEKAQKKAARGLFPANCEAGDAKKDRLGASGLVFPDPGHDSLYNVDADLQGRDCQGGIAGHAG